MTPRMDGPHGPSALIGPDGGHNGYLATQGLVFDWAHADFAIEGKTFKDIGLRYKGNGTYAPGSNKLSMKLHLTKYQKGQKLAGMSMINLANNITDPGWMNEELAYRLFRDAQVPRAADLIRQGLRNCNRPDGTALHGIVFGHRRGGR